MDNQVQPAQSDLLVKSSKSSRVRKRKLDDLLEVGYESAPDLEPPVGPSESKNKLRVYVLSGQIKELYGKIITEHELNKMSEQECEDVLKICELKVAQGITRSVVDGIITIFGNIVSRTLPIDNKDKYIAELKSAYIVNSELRNAAGKLAMTTGKFMAVLELVVITALNISLHRKELDKELEKDAQELQQELDKELGN